MKRKMTDPGKIRVIPRGSSVVRMYRRAVLRGLMAASASMAMPAPVMASESTREFVESLGRKVISQLAVSGISVDEREARFRELMLAYFDSDRISRFTLGKYVRRIGKDDLARFSALLQDIVVFTYAHRFTAYSGQNFRIARVTGAPGDRYRLVETEILLPNGNVAIRMGWQVLTRGEKKAIVDIRVAGVSMAIAQRDEFTSFLNNHNGDIAAFLDALKGRVAVLRERNRKD